MSTISRLSPWPRKWLLWAAVGLALRLLLIWFPRPIDDDTADYLTLGHNLFHAGTYGLGPVNDVSPSLFRLPAYPIVLATFEQLFAARFPHAWMNLLLVFQSLVEVLGCLLLASFAQRHISRRAADFVLALGMLCPFTAAYAAIALTECLSGFAIVLGLYAAGRAIAAAQQGKRDLIALVLAGCAAGLAAMLRPDGALLCVALDVSIFYYTLRAPFREPMASTARRWSLRPAFAAVAIYSAVALAPIASWTWRNWKQFQVFQPLAPRFLGDPGERTNVGFYRWMRTWSWDVSSTSEVYWHVGVQPIDFDNLPARAFDSPAQRQLTAALIAEYNLTNSISAALDERFAALAGQRVRANPLRYYIVLPLLRIADMLLLPRTYPLELYEFWESWTDHAFNSAASLAAALLNLGYVAFAAWAFFRRRVPFAVMLGGYLILRFLLLGTMENSETRYTVECFPVLILASGAALASLPFPLLSFHALQRRLRATPRHPQRGPV